MGWWDKCVCVRPVLMKRSIPNPKQNAPLTRGRLSAKFFRHAYLTAFFHTRCPRFAWNRATRATRSSTV